MKNKEEKLKKMEKALFRRIFVAMTVMVPLLQSCFGKTEDPIDLGDIEANAIVTVRLSSMGFTYFQLDESTTLEPSGWETQEDGEFRALLNYSVLDRKSRYCTKVVKVNGIDPITTKPASFIGTKYFEPNPVRTVEEVMERCDPVELVSSDGKLDWLTVCEDGYMTIHFACLSSGEVEHSVDMYADKNRPDHLYFSHESKGDKSTSWTEGLVAFKIDHLYYTSDLYPSGDPGTVTLHWMSFDGEKTATFKYGQRAIGK